MIYVTEDMPAEGQFIAAWVYEGNDWCATFKWIDGELHVYNSNEKYCFEELTSLEDTSYFDLAETVVYLQTKEKF